MTSEVRSLQNSIVENDGKRQPGATQSSSGGAARRSVDKPSLVMSDASAQTLTTESAGQALFEFDPVRNAFVWSDETIARRIFGADLEGSATSLAAVDKRIAGPGPTARAEAIADGVGNYSCEYQMTTADGVAHWFEERGGWIAALGERRMIGVLRSIDVEKQETEELYRRAEYDDLTGVLNRTQLRNKLEEVLADLEGDEKSGAYLIAGVDDVGGINTDFGFVAADEVICSVAERIAAVIGEPERIGRVAGTKFGIVVPDADAGEVRQVCIELLNSVRESVIATSQGPVAASICLGAIDLSPQERNANLIMARAEAALDEAKRGGRSSWSSFSEKTDVVSQRKRNSDMSDVILTALNERRIHIAFQPIVSDLVETPTKFECLVRMTDEQGNEVPAPQFIPVAEHLGLVHMLDRRVLELAINTLSTTPNIHLNVNISMDTVKDPVWAEGYMSLMRANAALASRITVELTETKIIDAVDASIEFVSELKSLGAMVAMDDFGAGYTSFRNLKALDFDILKIDGSFVTGVSSSRENQLFVRTLLDLARNFRMKTVAEWVDNEADAMVLKGLGVDSLQGFLIGKPDVKPEWLPDGAPNVPPERHT
ncbi:MAG: bifunctional diguanylate cyclase/phosphodiesterase [Pseudomonadota bacterium]